MKRALLFSIVIIVIGILSFNSCKKDVDIPDPYCVAGNEGDITLHLQPEHHGVPITGLPSYRDSAFIKYNADEFPGDDPAAYDLVLVAEPGSNEVVVHNLSCGTYFVFMTGFDTSINQRVKGGIPLFVQWGEKELTHKIPVTED